MTPDVGRAVPPGGVARPDLLSPEQTEPLARAAYRSIRDRLLPPPDEPMLVHCGHGERAMSAASLLERAGHRNVAVFAGGPGSLGPLEREA